jgi:hypothetical protein
MSSTVASPVFGQGVVPGQGSVVAELNAVTRRAFVPKMVVQIYQAAPFLSLAIRNAQRARGGLSQVTVPLQGAPFVNFGWTGYSGAFPTPGVQQGANVASWNLSVGTTPIPLYGMESLIQATESIIPLVKARMNDAKTVSVQAISAAIYGSAAGNALAINGLLDVYDDGTVVNTYGNVSRSANSYWKSVNYATSLTPSRTTMITQLMATTSQAGGEAPDFVLMSLSDWTTLMEDFMSAEQFDTNPTMKYGNDNAINAGFRALMLGNTPILADPFCPKGTAFIINSKYLALYLSEDANFAFSGFYSMIPNMQMANVGVLIAAMALVCTKPVSGRQLSAIQGGAF